jgi:hypothetical protein
VQISEAITIAVTSQCNLYRTVLEFTGLTGGLEYLPFEGGKSGYFDVMRTTYMNDRKINRPISNYSKGRYVLETRYADMYFSDYLAMLLLSTEVKLLLGTAEPLDVTVVSDSGTMQSGELFANQIEIEYDYGY